MFIAAGPLSATCFVATFQHVTAVLQGLIASIGLMPITFILPSLLWITSRRPRGFELWINVVIAGTSIILALLAFVGSMRNIIHDAKSYDLFD